MLEICLARLREKQRIMRYNEAAFWLKFWKSTDECSFLKECHSQVLQQKLKDLDKAFRDAFDKSQPNKRLPTWKKLHQHDNFRYPQGFKIENRRLYLPKIGWVGFYKSQAIIGTPKNVTISRIGQHWYASIQVEQAVEDKKHRAFSAIGIDLGVSQFAAFSDGSFVSPIHAYRTIEKKLAHAQRLLSRKTRFSSNWKKQKLIIVNIHRKAASIRNDFLHKTSTQVSHNHALIVVEDLKIKNMTRSASGTLESPGRNVKAKSGLSKSILDQGWGEFKRQLEYKQHWANGMFLQVSPQYTSQRCHQCGHAEKSNRVSQAEFHCRQCGHRDHADSNAAKNILAAGHAVLACGETSLLDRSMKQEPLRNCEKVAA